MAENVNSMLSDESCEVCHSGASSVTDTELSDLLVRVPDWSQGDIDGTSCIGRQFGFDNYREALDFVVRVGVLAEHYNHHPRIVLEWGKVSVTWWTHAISGLHRNDFVMAAKTELLVLNKKQ